MRPVKIVADPLVGIVIKTFNFRNIMNSLR